MILTCYLKEKLSIEEIKDLISNLFELERNRICEFLSEKECLIRFEYNVLDENFESDYNIELNLYCNEKSLLLNTQIYNNLILAFKVASLIAVRVLVNDESDDPYQWLEVIAEKLYLVEELDNDSDGINLNFLSKKSLIVEKALDILPGKEFIENDGLIEKEPYFVKNSEQWKKCEDE